MIKSEPFMSLESAREAAEKVANEQGRRQYILKIKSNYFHTDERPQESGFSGLYRLEGTVDPEPR